MVQLFTENRYVDRPVRGYDQVEEGDYVTVTVSDTGSGISREEMQKIYEPFYTKKVMGRSGTGLGMAITRRLVETHGGRMWLESNIGQGAAFFVVLPIQFEGLAMEKR